MTFAQLGLSAPLLRAVDAVGYSTPTPIQAAAIPVALQGRDVLGCAQTGTGKTASFTLPILERLQSGGAYGPRALILAPTRELAEQIRDNLIAYGRFLKLRYGMIIGGVGIRAQDAMLERGVDVLVATPGRLIDHMERRTIDLSDLQVLVLDEADRMLDMGFIHSIRKILKAVPKQRQTLMFSATLPDAIMTLANDILHKPQRISVAPPSTTPKRVDQVVHAVASADKKTFLLDLLASPTMAQVIVFTRTKWGANKLARHLQINGHEAAAIHGNKSQSQRRAALERFKSGSVKVLVATDIAARGLDVAGVSHVVNFELPAVPEDYVHRIGRTGRADATGSAVSLMSEDERPLVRAIEKLTGVKLLSGSSASSSAPSESNGRRPSSPSAPRRPQRTSRPGSSRSGSSRSGNDARASAGRRGRR